MPTDIVFAGRDINELIGRAKKLGYTKLVVVYNDIGELLANAVKSTEIKIIHAVLIKAETKNKLIREIERAKKEGALAFVRARNDVFNRFVMEKTKADLIFDLEYTHKKDHLHFRRSGLDQVLCKLAARNEKVIGVSLNSLLDASDRAMALGRIAQNIMFCRKYGVKMIFGSFARNINEMRGAKDMRSLLVTLGAGDGQSKVMMEFM